MAASAAPAAWNTAVSARSGTSTFRTIRTLPTGSATMRQNTGPRPENREVVRRDAGQRRGASARTSADHAATAAGPGV